MPMGWRISAAFGTILAVATLAGALLVEGAPASAGNDQAASAPSEGAAENLVVANDVRLGGDDNQIRFVVDLSRKIDIRAFMLANPYRVIIDMPQVNFQFPPKAGEQGRGLVKAFRYGLALPGASRMVIDLSAPARVEKAYVLPAAEGQPARLVLDLLKVDRETFLRAVAVDNRLPHIADPVRPGEPA